MINVFYWKAVLRLINDVSLSDRILTIEFDDDINRLSDDIDTLCGHLGLAIMSSPNGDREHLSIVTLEKSREGNRLRINLPVDTNFPGFIGIRVYYVYLFNLTVSRRFYMSKK